MKKKILFFIFVSFLLVLCNNQKLNAEEVFNYEEIITIGTNIDKASFITENKFIYNNEDSTYLGIYENNKIRSYFILSEEYNKVVCDDTSLFILFNNKLVKFNLNSLNILKEYKINNLEINTLCLNDHYLYLGGILNSNAYILKLNDNLDFIDDYTFLYLGNSFVVDISYSVNLIVTLRIDAVNDNLVFESFESGINYLYVSCLFDDDLDLLVDSIFYYYFNTDCTLDYIYFCNDELVLQFTSNTNHYYVKVSNDLTMLLNYRTYSITQYHLIPSYKDDYNFVFYSLTDSFNIYTYDNFQFKTIFSLNDIDYVYDYYYHNNSQYLLVNCNEEIKLVKVSEYEIIRNNDIHVNYYNFEYNLNDYVKVSSIFGFIDLKKSDIPYTPINVNNICGRYDLNINVFSGDQYLTSIKTNYYIDEFVNFVNEGIYHKGFMLKFFGECYVNGVEVFYGHTLSEPGNYEIKIYNNERVPIIYHITIAYNYYKSTEDINLCYDFIVDDDFDITLTFDYYLINPLVYVNNNEFETFSVDGKNLILHFELFEEDYQFIFINKIVNNNILIDVNRSYIVKKGSISPKLDINKTIKDDIMKVEIDIEDHDKTFDYYLINDGISEYKIYQDQTIKLKNTFKVYFVYIYNNELKKEEILNIELFNTIISLDFDLSYQNGFLTNTTLNIDNVNNKYIKKLEVCNVNNTSYITEFNSPNIVVNVLISSILCVVLTIIFIFVVRIIKKRKKKKS